MHRVQRSFSVLMLLLLMFSVVPRKVEAAEATDVANLLSGLEQFAQTIDQLGNVEALNSALPLSSLGFAAPDSLNLGQLFKDALQSVYDSAAVSTYSALQSALEDASGTYSGIEVTFDNVSVGSVSGSLIDVQFSVTALHTSSLPFAFEDDAVSLADGSFEAQLRLYSNFHFRLDSSIANPSLSFYLVNVPTIQLNANANGSIGQFTTNLGFTEVSASGSALVNTQVDITLVDTDGDGKLTIEDWQTTSIDDFFGLAVVDAPGNDVDLTLSVDTTLTSTSPDANFNYIDANLVDGLDTPSINWGDLLDFTNIDPTTVLNGLNQLVASLMSLEQLAGPELPFLQGKLTDAFEFAEPLINFIKQQGDAAIVCGTINSDPPQGDLSNLSATNDVYCQAVSLAEAQTVQWNVGNGTIVTSGTLTSTVAPNPSANVHIQLNAAEDPDIELIFSDINGDAHTVYPRFTSAQELMDRLLQLAGLSGSVEYDAQTQALTYRLTTSFSTDPYSTTLDFGDQLRDETNLIGLSSGSTASAEIQPASIELDLTFGILLVSDASSLPPINGAAGNGNNEEMRRFFVEVDTADGAYELAADATFTANVDLQGRLGFVKVNATGSSALNDNQGAFVIGPADDSKPVFSIDLDPQGGFSYGTTTLTNAIQLGNIISSPSTYLDADINLGMSAGLEVTASLNNSNTSIVTGGITIDWPDITVGTPTINPSLDFNDKLKVFDLRPGARGTHTGSADAATLTDSAAPRDFTQIYGLVGSRINNKTDGSNCEITSVTANTITCALAGGDDNNWDTGDEYDVDSDPLALLFAILDNIDQLAQTFDELTGAGTTEFLTKKLPLVNVSPQEIIDQFDKIRSAIDQLRSGQTAAQMRCGTTNTNPPSGDISSVTAGTTIYCQANANQRKINEVEWSTRGASSNDATTGSKQPSLNQAVGRRLPTAEHNVFMPLVTRPGERNVSDVFATVGANPTANISFIVGAGEASRGTTYELGADYDILLTFKGSGGTHVASLSTAQKATSTGNIQLPTSLDEFETMFEDLLGLPAQAFGLELRDLPAPGGTNGDGTQDLIVHLGYGICTQASTECDNAEIVEPLEIPIKLELGADMPDLVGLQTDSTLTVSYTATANLDLAIPLKTTFDANSIVVIDSSGVELGANVSSDDLNLTANVGPISVQLGTTVDIDPNTAGVQPGAGVAGLGAEFILSHTSVTDLANTPENTYTFANFFTNLNAELDGVNQDCGSAIKEENGVTSTVTLNGEACARLALGVNNTYLGDLAFNAPELHQPSNWEVIVPPDLAQQLLDAVLDWSLIIQSLPVILDNLADLMENGGANVNVPLIGDALDGGADVVNAINTNIVTPLANLAAELEAAADQDNDGDIDPTDLQLLAQEKTFDLIGSSAIFQDSNGDGDKTKDDIVVTIKCASGVECQDGDPLTDISDLRLTFKIGMTGSKDLPFDIGMDGFPLGAEGNVVANYGWAYIVDFGLSRNDGPYLGTTRADIGNTGLTVSEELSLFASVGLSEAGNNGSACSADDPATTGNAALDDYESERCLSGTLGFLAIDIRDSELNPTTVAVSTSLDITSSSGDRLKLSQLFSSQAGLDFRVGAAANLDMRIRTGLRDGQDSGFPSVIGVFQLEWGWAAGADPQPNQLEIQFKHIKLDLGSFLSKYFQPIIKEVRKFTKPLQPVIDTLMAPLPVLSDLSRLIGGGDISLWSLIKAVTPEEYVQLIERIIGLIQFVNTVDQWNGNALIPLHAGDVAFTVSAGKALGNPLSPTSAGELIETSNGSTNVLNDIQSSATAPRGIAKPDTASSGAFGVKGLSFPFLSDAGQIFGVLMGQDATLVRFDAGILRASAGMNYTFGPIFIGPIPISIGLAGSVEVRGRFAIGYDTSGLRKVLTENASGVHLFDGIFLDDLDENGIDVPEVSLIGTVSASAALDAVIVAAGVEGGIRFTTDLNLNDSPDPDGKLRIGEIWDKLQNPICLFDVSGKLEAFLNAFVRIGFSFFSKTFRIKIASIVLLDFSFSCNPPDPDLASISNGNLVLKMGPNAGGRGIQEDEIDENFTVRQLAPTDANGTRVSVTAFGIVEEETIPVNGKVIADGGDGDDVIRLEAGGDANGNVIPFTVQAELSGGSGSDELRGGDANDILNGGSGEDVINGNAGNDSINGGSEADILSGDEGTDTIYGEAGDDILNGGSGGDYLYGGAGNDDINGGPGSNTPTALGNNPDLGDYIEGGTGDDTLDGGFGDDTIYGDEVLSCLDEGAANGGADQITGGYDNDQIFGGNGADTLVGEDGDDILCGNGGQDLLEGDDLNTTNPNSGLFRTNVASYRMQAIQSTNGNDTLYGGSGPDTLYGRGGHDKLFGNAGADYLYGGTGNDDLVGGSDSDFLFGEAGIDYLMGDDGTITRSTGASTASSVTPNPASGAGDTMNGGSEADYLYGEGGNDTMFGGSGNDEMYGHDGTDTMHGDGNNDTMFGGNGTDTMFGDAGTDMMFGDAGNDTMYGGLDNDYIEGNADSDTIQGELGDDVILGGSSAPGTPDAGDTIEGNPGRDLLIGDNASVGVGANPFDWETNRAVTLLDPTIGGNDTISGHSGEDRLYGGPANDTLYGGDADDYLEGNQGTDSLYGELGQDDLIGGSSQAGAADTTDTIYGGEGHDVIAGDNAAITRAFVGTTWTTDDFSADATAVARRSIVLFDVATTTNTPAASTSAADKLYGEAGYDRMFGQGGNDDLYGGSGDDELQGNAGADLLIGHAGQDDLIGGTGLVDSADSASAVDGRLDAADTIYGGNAGVELTGDFDVILGDNGIISRATTAQGAWATDSFSAATPGVLRRVTTLLDVATVDSPAAAGTFGADTLYGEGSRDIIYGQGGDEEILGGSGDDHIEGNAGNDTILGNAGQDDLIGGTGRTISNDPASAVDGRLDGVDTIYGGNAGADLQADHDIIAGDNAVVERLSSNGTWLSDDFSSDVQDLFRRRVTLLDISTSAAAAAAGTSAGDTLHGEAGRDVLYGQGGDEVGMFGGSGDDYIEGNAGNDVMFGNADQDDLIGGTGRTISDDPASASAGRLDGADLIYGGDNGDDVANDYDVIIGDNATVIRPTTNGAWDVNTFNASFVRTLVLYDVATTATAASAGTSGADELYGEGNDDLMYGQGDDDTMLGGNGDDYMEGNHGADTMNGNAGNDDMVGGTGRINADGPSGSDGRLDGADTMHGDAGFDTMAGDNAVLVRVLVNGAWQPNGFNGGIQHERRILRDLDSAAWQVVSGPDTMFGDADDDLMYGQASDDTMFGNAGDDVMEGNAHSDLMEGNDGQDDMIGGTTQAALTDANDTMSGGAGHDVLLGDNGNIERPLDNTRQWLRDTFALDTVDVVQRDIRLYDLDSAVGNTVNPAFSGGDLMYGDADRDVMFGQGNGAQAAQADPQDGLDNDLDGVIDEDAAWLGDVLHGGSGDDYMEGNHGADWMFGDEDQDDLIGGHSTGNGVIGSGSAPNNMADTGDVLLGGSGDDNMFGDNGTIDRPVDNQGRWLRIVGGEESFDMVVRETSMLVNKQQAGAFGNDYMLGNADHDDMFGQAGDDYMEGNTGEDAMVGDLGVITNVLEDGSREEVIKTRAPFLEETIYREGSLTRQVELFALGAPYHSDGNDIMLGGDNHDSMHGGLGNDIMNGDGDIDIPETNDADALFGADGDDVIWGGRGNDHLWGGYGDDHLDVKPRPGRDPETWFTYGGVDNYQDLDIIYGGWDQDAMQANIGEPGPRVGDRLLDWVGAYNVYYTCPGAYGEGVITRSHSPSVIKFLQELAEANGAHNTKQKTASGYQEVAMVFPKDSRHNSHPTHPDHPGHFTCN